MNTLELSKHESGSYATTINTDGVESWELHRAGLDEVAVLKRLKEKNYFQHKKGDWMLTIAYDQKVFKDKKFETAIDMAIAYIHERDHPCWEDHF